MSTAGDWICKSCNHLNFYWRQSCRRCKDPQPHNPTTPTQPPPGPRLFTFRPGDWFCDVSICRAHNFARRRICFKCGSLKLPSLSTTPTGFYNPLMSSFTFPGTRISRHGWKPGDWFCGRPDCYAHNYAHRNICFKCNSSRELLPNLSSS